MANPFDANATAYDEVQVTTHSSGNSALSSSTSAVVQNQTKQHISNAYEATTEDFRSANAAVADHNPPPETPSWLMRCFNWMPLRWFLFFAGLAFTGLAVLDFAVNGSKAKGIGNLVFFYLFCTGIVIMIVEGPVMKLTRGCQLSVFYWFRLLSRLWGRAWFYMFTALLSFSNIQIPAATCFAGFYVAVLLPFMLIVSRFAAQKYQRIFVFVAAGAEGEEREKRFSAKFDELDTGRTGFLSSNAIVTLAAQAGRSLSNAERHAIQTFLDASSNGKVSKEDFLRQFREHNLKQRFL